MVLKTLYIRQQRTVTSEDIRGESHTCPSSPPWEHLLCSAQEREQGRAQGYPKDGAASPGRPRQLEFTGQDTVEEKAAARKCWRSVGSFSQVFHQIYMSPRVEENYCRQREEPSKRIRGNSVWSLHRATIVSVPPSQTQKTLQFPGRLFRRLLP